MPFSQKCCICNDPSHLMFVRGYFFCPKHDNDKKVGEWVVLQQAKQVLKDVAPKKEPRRQQHRNNDPGPVMA